MKTKLFIPILSLLLLVSNVTFANNSNINNDPEKDKVLISVLNYMLTRGHFVEKELDDKFSAHVFNTFIESLDSSKRYFTTDDIKRFSQFKYKIDNQLLTSDLSFYNLVYDAYLEKVKTASGFYEGILAEPFDYSKEETIDVDFDKMPFPKDQTELKDNWRKQLKLQTIDKIQELEALEEDKSKKDKSYKKKVFAEIEKEARGEVLQQMKDLYIRIQELEHRDWFSSFLNSVVSAFDPHTSYLNPNKKEEFDQGMSGKLEGIGARLVKQGIYTEIVELVSGGPAWKQGDLEEGDIILKVTQDGEDKEPLDIVGMRLDDAIKFIKGPKGTIVHLTVKKKIDGSTKTISITRDLVQLEETFVKSSVVIKDGKKYGVIDLPKFYISFGDQNFRDSAKDMAKEIERLKSENVEGLLLDLRNNGGGSLKTAIEIAGLFIDQGPVVQIKYRGEKPVVQNDKDPKIQWNGSLVILVNELSASASEIVAAALQDYNRAVIIGGNQTYGKGTVQNVLPINQFYPNYDKDLGFLKMTIQKFYRINGGSTQMEGVYSDIAIPDRYSYMKFGERDVEGALKWDMVPQAKYTTVDSYSNFSEVVNTSKERIANDPKFKLVNEYAKWLKQQQDDTSYSLNYKDYVKDVKDRKIYSERFNSVFEYQSDNKFQSPKYEKELTAKDTDLREKRKVWHKNLSKDMYIAEALNVLSQLKLKVPQQLVKN